MAVEGNTRNRVNGERNRGTAESKTPSMSGNHKRENREIPLAPVLDSSNTGRSANLSEGNADMNADGKSDDFVVPSTRANKTATAAAESVEERKSPKGRVVELPSMYRTLRRISHHLERRDDHDRYPCSAARSFDLTEEPYEAWSKGAIHPID